MTIEVFREPREPRSPDAWPAVVLIGFAAVVAILVSAWATHEVRPRREPAEVRAFCVEQCGAFGGWLLGIEIRQMPDAAPEFVCSCALEPDRE